MRHIVFVLILFVTTMCFGCSNAPTTPDYSQPLLGECPDLTGIVGSYTYTGSDGSVETGNVIRTEDGSITFASERESSILTNSWFNIQLDYYNHHGLYQNKWPIYHCGDTILYKLNIEYLRLIPLNIYPFLYSKLETQQRYFNFGSYTPGSLLPGDAIEIWDPLEIEPLSSFQITDEYWIPDYLSFNWGCTTISIEMEFMGGLFEMNMITGLVGVWDP